MKPTATFEINRKALYTALAKANRTLLEPIKCRAMKLPAVFSCFVFRMSAYKAITIHTTDRDMSTDITLPLVKRRGRIKDFAVYPYELLYILRRVDDETITVSLYDYDDKVVFQHSSGSFTLPLVKDGIEAYFFRSRFLDHAAHRLLHGFPGIGPSFHARSPFPLHRLGKTPFMSLRNQHPS